MEQTTVVFGRRNLLAPKHFELLDIRKYNEKNKAIVINFAGNGAISISKIARFCGTVERWVGLKLGNDDSSYKNVDVLGFAYDQLPGEDVGEFSMAQRNLIAKCLFVKRCFDENGNLLSADELEKSFSKINIVSHCHGAYEASYIGIIAERMIKSLGYTEADIRRAFNQVLHISYAPKCQHSSFPMIKINSFIDSLFRDTASRYKRAYGEDLRGVDIRYDKPGRYMGIVAPMNKVPILSIYSSQLINTPENSNLNSLVDEHIFATLERDNDWNQGYQSKNAKNAELVSSVVACCLAEAMAVSIRNSVLDNEKNKTDEHVSGNEESVCMFRKRELHEYVEIYNMFRECYSESDLLPVVDIYQFMYGNGEQSNGARNFSSKADTDDMLM